MKMVKITTIVCLLIMLLTPLVGATSTNNPDSSTHTFCRGLAYGEIEDYELSPTAQLIFLLRGKPSELLISRATIVIKQDPDMMSLKLISPIKHYCMVYYGDITIHFYASMVNINLDAVENCENCTYIICQGFFGLINVEQN